MPPEQIRARRSFYGNPNRLRYTKLPGLPVSPATNLEEALDELNTRTYRGGGRRALLRQGIEIVEDFPCNNTTSLSIGTHGWGSVESGTGAGTTTSSGASSIMAGLLTLSTGTTTTGRAALRLYGGVLLTGAPVLECDWYIQPLFLQNAGVEDVTIRAGLLDGTGASEPTDGFYIELTPASTNWFAVTADGGTRTKTDTGVAYTGFVPVRLSAECDGAGAAQFLIDDVVVAGPITTNLPDSGDDYGPMVSITKSAGTTAATMIVDYCYLWAGITR